MTVTLTMEELRDLYDEQQGMCVACGDTVDGVEPDARGRRCGHCGSPSVYGAEELPFLPAVQVEL